MKRTNTTRILEIIAIIITGIGKFLFIDIYNFKLGYIVVACLGWAAYIAYCVKRDKSILDYFGFRREGLRETLSIILPISVLSFASFVAIGLLTGKMIISWHIIPIMLLYPIWGTIQQFLMIGLIATNLRDLKAKAPIPQRSIIIIVAILFALVHYPSYELIAGTFLLALLYTFVFLKYRNLWVLGFFHGWLGCLFYFFVLGSDPWLEIMGSV